MSFPSLSNSEQDEGKIFVYKNFYPYITRFRKINSEIDRKCQEAGSFSVTYNHSQSVVYYGLERSCLACPNALSL